MGKMAKDQPDPRTKEARVAGIKNKLRRGEEMKKIKREKKKVSRQILISIRFLVDKKRFHLTI